MIQALPIITAILGMSHNQGSQKAANLINSAASFINKKPKPKDKDNDL